MILGVACMSTEAKWEKDVCSMYCTVKCEAGRERGIFSWQGLRGYGVVHRHEYEENGVRI